MRFSLIFLVSNLFFVGCQNEKNSIIRNDFEAFYAKNNLKGSFVIFHENTGVQTMYNEAQLNESFSPASTFKICNSLIALEIGVATDENFELPWDSVVRDFEPWNQNHTLKSAFQNSAVWYYQEIARRIGEEHMQKWVKDAHYGNADISGGIDLFWLAGNLRVTPMQQIDFLKRLRNEELPFSKRTVEIVKEIMVVDENPNYVLRGKTGWSGNDTRDVGWFIGYLEVQDQVYYFANCVQSEPNNPFFVSARKEIVYDILRELDLID